MTTLFTRYARLTLLLVILIAAAGAGAFFTLGRQEDPTLVERYGIITTIFPGASAERVETLVSEPIEERLLELGEVERVESVSRAGVSQTQVELREDLSPSKVDQAWTLVHEQTNLARANFPPGVQEPSIRRLYLGAATMIVAVSWRDGSDQSIGVISRLATDLEKRFQSMPGTEETRIYGPAEEEVRVLADPDKLAALGLTTVDIAGVLAAADAKAPAGSLNSERVNLGVEIAGELDSLDRVRRVTVLQTPAGDEVRVGDIARLEKGVRTPPASLALADGERTVLVAAFLTPNQRVDLWTERARALVEGFRAELPGGVEAKIIFEQDTYVNKRLHGLAGNLLMSALIVFIVLFLTMGWRSAIVVGSALPLTLLLVLFLFSLSGEPLHQMSVTGLVIALGLLIDNAIVVVDEYRIQRGRGRAPLEAVDGAVKHLFAPLLASTLTTMLAFAPIALMPGSAGEFIGFMAVSVIYAVGSSFLIAMTIVPAFAAWFDRVPKEGEPKRIWRDGVTSAWVSRLYRATVAAAVRAPVLGFAGAFILPAVGFVMMSTLPMQFFPATQRDMFQMTLELPPEASIAETRREVERATELIGSYPGVEHVGWVVGEGPPRTYYNVYGGRQAQANYAAGWVRTTSDKRTREMVGELQARVIGEFPNARFLVLPFEQGPPISAPIEIRLYGPDAQTLARLGDELRGHLSRSLNVTYTTASLKLGAPVARVKTDESAARLGGRALNEIAGLMRADLDGAVGGSVLEGAEELPVRVILDDAARSGMGAVRSKPLPGIAGGDSTPLSALGEVSLEPEIATITRRNGQRINTIEAFLTPYSLPDATMKDLAQRLEAAGFEMPPGARIEIGGEAAERGDAVGKLMATAAPLLILIIGSLVLAFNSFSYAGVIALVGVQSVGLAFFGIWIFDQTNGFNAIVGSMGLVGLAINGSIVVLSGLKANAEARAGDPKAITDEVMQLTRHILATTLTTMGGFAPLILSGDPFWLPLATAIAGGVGGSALIALYFAPAAFVMLEKGRRKRDARKAARALAPAE